MSIFQQAKRRRAFASIGLAAIATAPFVLVPAAPLSANDAGVDDPVAAKVTELLSQGKALIAQEKYSEAEARFRHAVDLDPNNIEALAVLGPLLKTEGKDAEADEFFQRFEKAAQESGAASGKGKGGPKPPARSTAAGTPRDVQAQYRRLADAGAAAVGQKVLAMHYSGLWLPATVVEVEKDRRYVKFDGSDDSQNAWVTPDKVHPADFTEKVLKLMPPRVGETVEAPFSGKWYPVTVLQIDGVKRLVHFDSSVHAADRWVDPAMVRPAADTVAEADKAAAAKKDDDAAKAKDAMAHPAPAQAGTHDMNGWWVVTRANVRSSRLDCAYYWFRNDGRVYFSPGPPTTFADADFDRILRSEPQNIGTYGSTGGRLVLQRNGSGQRPGGFAGGGVLQEVRPIRDGQTLNGSWSIVGGATFGGVQALHSDKWVFRADGTFEHDIVAAVDTKDAKSPDRPLHEAGATGKSETIGKGRYRFSDGQLRLSGDGGATQSLPACGIGSNSAKPSPLVIGGKEYHQDS